MKELREYTINNVKFLATEDFSHVVEIYEDGTVLGEDILTKEETTRGSLDSVLSEMKEKFEDEFKIQESSAKEIRTKADSLKRQGYSCSYDMVDSSVSIFDKSGSTIYTAVGKEVDKLIQTFEKDPASLDTSISIEDYCLAKLV